ncbi:hypothetical protein HPHPA27_0277 [Helicobacter pylori Hp A-27]|uniref:Uncharacterized protein n=1 Tax=Helicobacter pylori PZ5056 TaxID=1337393 RepID=T2T7F3_HELPX|nr:hypothetical protein HPHPA27_0277 [Helicobacter pylori Hp A-27]EQD99719.1 hypothetical protein L933_08230 [Helicobacter pylori PZ5056]
MGVKGENYFKIPPYPLKKMSFTIKIKLKIPFFKKVKKF